MQAQLTSVLNTTKASQVLSMVLLNSSVVSNNLLAVSHSSHCNFFAQHTLWSAETEAASCCFFSE